ncbi:hypothetical protein [Allokutzneria oryzae]|uniref:Uncharacterized protein n=1 Tax=Allokutzneria oryzae TaxID=1378989 RepID=A0ABV6A3N7_9PSEU
MCATAPRSSRTPIGAALAFYGPERGHPGVHSPHRGYWYFGASTTLYVGGSQAQISQHFDRDRGQRSRAPQQRAGHVRLAL